ncbi:hypothetical protein [Pseudomonas sp. LB1P83]
MLVSEEDESALIRRNLQGRSEAPQPMTDLCLPMLSVGSLGRLQPIATGCNRPEVDRYERPLLADSVEKVGLGLRIIKVRVRD